MSVSWRSRYTPLARLALTMASAVIALSIWQAWPTSRGARAQDAANPPAPAALHDIVSGAGGALAQKKTINIFALAAAGGIFMIPIAGMSLLAGTVAIERAFALRRSRVLPEGLVTGLGEISSWAGGFEPRKAYLICAHFPSAAANVVRVMLLRAGRPLSEIESAVAQASQREADKLYANVRWLNLAASLSTMLGLIGTIQGMILAFHRLTVMDAAADRTTVLADGIYTALVTTFAGLAVAIPALLASHFFEGRILKLFHQIDELVLNLLPQLERYEGRVRFGANGDNGSGSVEEPVPPPRPALSDAP